MFLGAGEGMFAQHVRAFDLYCSAVFSCMVSGTFVHATQMPSGLPSGPFHS